MPSLRPGETLCGFRIEEFIDSGATSEVYRATMLETEAPAAIKLLHPAWHTADTIRARFENEGRTLLGLQHPHIVRAIGVGEGPEDLPFLALEWAPNDLRRQLQRSNDGLDIAITIRLTRQLADALCTLHTHGLIHRDLKPANILLTSLHLREADVKLADLGLAKHLPDALAASPSALELSRISTARASRLGTWEYMAPELWIDAKNAHPKSDVYGLGCLLFHLLVGHPLFRVTDEHALMFHHLFEPPPLSALENSVPARLRDLMAVMLTKKVDGRPTMTDVHRELKALDVPR